MADLEITSNIGQFLKILGNQKRLEILFTLQHEEKTVSELEQAVNLSQSALSQHLAKLRNHEIVQTRRAAQSIFYSIKNPKVLPFLEYLSEIFAEPSFKDQDKGTPSPKSPQIVDKQNTR